MSLNSDIADKVRPIESLAAEVEDALSVMCTTSAQETASKEYGRDDDGNIAPLLKRVDLWPELIAKRASSEGGGKPYLDITERDDYGRPTAFVTHGTPTSSYMTEENEDGETVVRSEIPRDNRVWSAYGWKKNPSLIEDAFDMAKGFIEECASAMKAGGLLTKWSNGSWEAMHQNDPLFLFFPDLKKPYVEENGTETYIDTSTITDWTSIFQGSNIMEVPAEIDTSGAVEVSRMFSNCKFIKKLPKMDFSKVKNLKGNDFTATGMSMFGGCSRLEDASGVTGLGDADGINVQTVGRLFSGCSRLVSVPKIDCSRLGRFYSMFNGCSSIVDVTGITNIGELTNPGYHTNESVDYPIKYTDFGSMFNGCSSLKKINSINLTRANRCASMFSGCKKLSSIKLTGCIQYFGDFYNRSQDYAGFKDMFKGCESLSELTFCGISAEDSHINSTPSMADCVELRTINFPHDSINWKVLSAMITTLPARDSRTTNGMNDGHKVEIIMTQAAYDSLSAHTSELESYEETHGIALTITAGQDE